MDASAPIPDIFALSGFSSAHTSHSINPTIGIRNPSIAHPILPLSFTVYESSLCWTPHDGHMIASSSICVPHLRQYAMELPDSH